MENNYNEIKTIIERVVFYNETSKWGVLAVRNVLDNDPIFMDKTITLTGNFDKVYAGCEIIFSGSVISNAKYGFQIALDSLRINKDTTNKESIINFLIKSNIKGISVANATKIYKKFGSESIKIVLHQTKRIKEIPGIGESTYNEVASSIQEYLRMEELVNFCTKHNIPYSLMCKLDREFGNEALNIIKNEPYSIIELTDEFSFNAVDEIALKLGVDKENSSRLRAALIFCTKTQVMMSSSTGIRISDLKSMFGKVTGVTYQGHFNATLNTLINEELVIIDGNIVYWKYYYDKEEFAAKLLSYLVSVPLKVQINQDIIDKAISKFPFTLNKQQVDAVNGVIGSRVSVITGGPGTGKSTITKAIVDIFKASNIDFALLSPTGKATRRLSECTKEVAMTIHKYLNAQTANLDDVTLPIVKPDTAIIIDESSMLDILMFSKILEIAKFSPIRLILIGDKDQLPSVQVGNVLEDVINSEYVNVYQLTDIMRQASDSHIIKYCADVNNGDMIPQKCFEDFEYIEFYDDNDLLDELEYNYSIAVERYGLAQVQVITPYKKGTLGTLGLNRYISEFYNHSTRNNQGYAVGDKVMQVRNDYHCGVFNGECGKVVSITEDSIDVVFPSDIDNSAGVRITYDEKNYSDIILAYSSTCHKSQGSEYAATFVILDDSNGNFLLTRKLLYTALSRGKSKVYLYSMPMCVSKCIKNVSEVQRITKLRDFIQTMNSVPVEVPDFDFEEIEF